MSLVPQVPMETKACAAMSRLLKVSQAVEAPSAAAAMAYLRAQGWQQVRTDSKWSVFARNIQGESVEFEVPLLEEAPDYPRRITELLWNLERAESRPAWRILRDMRACTLDILRIAVQGASATEDGRISMESGARLFVQARELLLAADCAALERRAVQARRKPEQAMEYLRQVRLGPTEASSFVITVESSIAPKLQEVPALVEDPHPPYERLVMRTLAQALSGARMALSDTAASGSLEPFLQRVSVGVSANPCEAVAGLLVEGEAQLLTFDFQFAPARPAPPFAPEGPAYSVSAK